MARTRKGTGGSGKGKPRTPKDEKPKVTGGVLVRTLEGPQGEIRQATLLEGTKLTEAPTLLRLAARDIERELEID